MPDCDIFNNCFAAIIALPGLNLKKKIRIEQDFRKTCDTPKVSPSYN